MKILLLLLFPLTLFGASRGVSYDSGNNNVYQVTLNQTFALITNSGATASTPAGYDANKKLVSMSTTGTGSLVQGGSPTITTPTIASFVNAAHTHANAAGGGTLDAAAIGSGAFATARLAAGTASNGFVPVSNGAGLVTWTAQSGSGGGGTAGSMINVGANIMGGIPVATDTTDTNYVPSRVTILGGTNLLAGTVHGTNQVSGGRFIGTGVTADSRVDVPDDDGSAYAGFQANNTTTTAVNFIYPAAPFAGLANWAITSGTNWAPTQLAGTSGGVIYFSAANTPATSGALAANALVVGGGAGAAPATVTTGSGVLTALGNTANATGGILTVDGTATPLNKAFDAAGTGNVLKQTKTINLQRPDYGDGVGAVPQTNAFNVSGLMHFTFSGNAETNANYTVYEFDCPPDLDTAVAMTARFAFLSGGTDADDYVFHVTYGQVAPGTAYPTGTGISSLPIVMTVTPTTAASGDLQASSAVTLTGWAAALTPGRAMTVRIARLQNTQDDGARDVQLVISYGSTL